MKPLVVLIACFLVTLGYTELFYQHPDYSFAGRLSMSVMLIFTSIGHIRYTHGMILMLPPVIPYRKPLVYLTGLLEILAAIGLLMPSPWAQRSAWCLIIFFIVLLPANIYAAFRQVDYEKGNFEGRGLAYLWFRVPLQLLFICWVYFFALR